MLEEALVKAVYLHDDILLKLGIAYNKNGQSEKAIEAMMTTMVKYNDLRVREGLIETYAGFHGSTKGLASLIITSAEAAADSSLETTPVQTKESMDVNEAIIYVRSLNAREAPEFSVVNFDVEEFTNESLAGKVVVLDFWGVWCYACLLELPYYQEAVTKYKGNNSVVFLAVSNDKTDKIVTDYMAEQEFTFSVARDPEFNKSFGVRSYPTMMILGKNGKIMYEHNGFNTERDFVADLSAQIDLLLTAK